MCTCSCNKPSIWIWKFQCQEIILLLCIRIRCSRLTVWRRSICDNPLSYWPYNEWAHNFFYHLHKELDNCLNEKKNRIIRQSDLKIVITLFIFTVEQSLEKKMWAKLTWWYLAPLPINNVRKPPWIIQMEKQNWRCTMASCDKEFLKLVLNSIQRCRRSCGLKLETDGRTNIMITIYLMLCVWYKKTMSTAHTVVLRLFFSPETTKNHSD